VKAISLTQPWATLVAIGEKKIETRSWQTRHRGPIAIHAAKNFPADCRDLTRTHPFSTALIKHGVRRVSDLPLGQVVAIAELRTCVQLPAAAAPKDPSWERAFGDYSRGRWIWILENVVRLSVPMGAKGAQGVWDWDVDEAMITTLQARS
jgi:hypothetical protein